MVEINLKSGSWHGQAKSRSSTKWNIAANWSRWTAYKSNLYRQRRHLGLIALLSALSFAWLRTEREAAPHFFLKNDFVDDDSSTRVACRYHGNCPEGTACSIARGLCFPYHQGLPHNNTATTPTSSKDPAHQLCVQTCLKELTVEEKYQYRSTPVIQFTSVAAPPHFGCVIHFQRLQEKKSTSPSSPLDMTYRIAQRLRSVVRVDFSGQSDRWMALCNHPCQTDRDCPVGLACLGRRGYQPSPEEANWTFTKNCLPRTKLKSDMVVVTAADTNYFFGLENFAASLRFWAPTRKLVIYNLGMTDDELRSAESWPNVDSIRWKDGVPASFPPHVGSKLKQYAWKSLIVNETVHEYKSMLWFDAGATFVGPIEPIEEITHQHGLFLVKGQDDDMKRLSEPATYQWFGYDKATYQAGPHYAGNTQGYVYPSRYIDSIVIPNAKCALDPECIAPTGSWLDSHRYDQTSLSILAHQQHIRAPSYTEFLAGGAGQLHMGGENLSVASTPFILWTSRSRCTYYSRYFRANGVDQKAHRAYLISMTKNLRRNSLKLPLE